MGYPNFGNVTPSNQQVDDTNSDVTEQTDEERAAQSERDARGEDGYRRDDDGNVVNDEENEFALRTSPDGTVLEDPNK